jgi:hypothetical protein
MSGIKMDVKSSLKLQQGDMSDLEADQVFKEADVVLFASLEVFGETKTGVGGKKEGSYKKTVSLMMKFQDEFLFVLGKTFGDHGAGEALLKGGT